MPKGPAKMIDAKTRWFLFYDFKSGISVGNSVRKIHSIFGEDAVGLEGAKKWFQKFRSGHTPDDTRTARADETENKRAHTADAPIAQKKPRMSKKKPVGAEHTIKVEVEERGYLNDQLERMQAAAENEAVDDVEGEW